MDHPVFLMLVKGVLIFAISYLCGALIAICGNKDKRHDDE